jgi:23S rRNA pseudouridine2605 synthase
MAKKADQESNNVSTGKPDAREKPVRRNLRKEAAVDKPVKTERKSPERSSSDKDFKKPARKSESSRDFEKKPRESSYSRSGDSDDRKFSKERPQRSNLRVVKSDDSDSKPRFNKEKSYDSDSKPRFNKEKSYDSDSKPRYNKEKSYDSDSKPRYNKEKSYDSDSKPSRKPFEKREGDRDSRPRIKSDRKEDSFEKPKYKSDRKDSSFDKPRFNSDRKEDSSEKPRYSSDRKSDSFGKPKFQSDKRERTFDKPKREGFQDRRDNRKTDRDFDKPKFDSESRKPGNDEWLDEDSSTGRPVSPVKYERGSKRGPLRDKESKGTSEWKDEVPASWKKKPVFTKKKKEPTLEEKDGKIRLNKYIANAGICSRREADELIASGAVKVNGKIVTELGTRISPEDKIQYGDETLSKEVKRYLLLNKPKDYITTAIDPEGRKTVMELIEKACKERLYPVGRLDRATTGLLLFTNDGEIARKLTHPSQEIKKVYHVTLSKNLKPIDLKRIMEGLDLEDGRAEVDSVDYIAEGKDKNEIGIELHSGKNRIVRRIFEHLGYEVIKLDRTFFAGLNKKDLPRGKFRFLTEKEVILLRMS